MGTLSLFPAKKRKVTPREYKDATLSDFSGGLDLSDNDVTLKSRFSKVLTNFNRQLDGSNAVRWGTKFFCRIDGAVSGDMIEQVYFSRHILTITEDGEICSTDDTGVSTAIWNSTIAGALVGAPSGWSTGLLPGSIDTTEFKGELIIVNGIDKPLIVHSDLTVEYLNDPASGSNVNTPISRFITTVSNYVVMAGIDAAPNDIYISNQATSGVWLGDAAPNDAVVVSIGSYVPANSGEILGIGSFRNFLLVAFEGAVVVVELGQYNTATPPAHTPKIQDNIVEHGIISHRTTVTTKNDFIMADVLGWHSAIRNQFGLIDTNDLSKLINPGFIPTVPNSTNDRKRCFSVRNPLENRVMTVLYSTTDPVVWVMTSSDQQSVKNQSWNQYIGMDWDCGCSTERGRVFFGKGIKIFQYGNGVYEDEDYNADLLGDYDTVWATTTGYVVGDKVLKDDISYVCLIAHTSGTFDDDLAADKWEEYTGEAIDFDWELPWTDINTRARTKFLKMIQADTKGTAQFTIDVFVDNYYKDENNEYDPAVSLEFVAGDSPGYGGGDQPYGGGRRLQDERPWGLPAEFKIMKLRFHGSTKKPLSVITFTILYWIGTFRR
jgi:hypothetical protein